MIPALRNATLLFAITLASCSTYRGTGHVVDTAVGVPSRRCFHHEKLVVHSNYCSAFHKKRKQPTWVAWTLSSAETNGKQKRANNFQPDSLLRTKYRVTTRDYSNSGYDRGHLCPAADNKFSRRAMDECFLMSNMCPQLHELNAGGWQALEDSCRIWAVREDSIVVVAGPVFQSRRPPFIGTQHKVAVPDAFFKVVLSLRPGHEKAIGFLFSNSKTPQSVEGAARSVREVERIAKLNFFPRLPKQQQDALETKSSLADWR
ncbi:MAG: DNA/RNA non-specific endonuclease [Paludibacteraceae bacterium]|nr:DNA/RNA non-specific endonuclease [Paludibacteraceae bacterium]